MIVDLLNDGNSNVRLAGAYAIGNLAQECKVIMLTTPFDTTEVCFQPYPMT
jgi:hypothetical protein